MHAIAVALAESAGFTEKQLVELCTGEHAIPKMLARNAMVALTDLHGALSNLKDANYWVRSVANDVDAYLEQQGRWSLNSLGVLQAKGAALDVAATNVTTALKTSERALELLHDYLAS